MADIKTSAAAPIKKPKKKGPIRFEAVIPFTIVVALFWAYFFFFFDMHARHALEYVATQGNGAEVNIGSLHTSFWRASLEINKVEITDAEEPAKNKLQIGQIRWNVLWDALLRGKIAIEDASILAVAIGAPRAKPGFVIPPPPPSDKPSATDKLKEQALAKAQEEFSQNVLGDVAAVLGGVDPSAQLKNMEGELKSSAQVKKLQTELAGKEKEWKERLAKLPQQKEIQALEAKVKSVKLDRFNNPAEVQQSIQQLDAIFKEADAKIKEVDATQKALNSDVGTYQNAIKEVEAMVQKDVKDLENRLKLPKLDVQSLSKSIFGPMFLGKVKQAEGYLNKARQYAPPKKSKTEKSEFKPPTPQERAKGRNYKFGRPNTYPLFWLKQAKISSKVTPGADFSGNLEGTLKDVTDDPPVLGRPTLALFKGDFPKQGVMGVDGKLTIDHVTEKPIEKLNLKVASFPVTNRVLVNSPEVTLGIDGATGATTFDVELSGESLKIVNQSTFARGLSAPLAGQPAPKAFLFSEAKQPILAEILKKALDEIPKVTLDASVGGTWTALRFDIDSSLGRDLGAAFDKQIQAKVAEARAKLQAFINDRVGKEKEKLTTEFNKIKGQVDGLLKQKQDEVAKAKGGIEKAKNDAVNNQKKGLEKDGKKAIDDLKKKFGF